MRPERRQDVSVFVALLSVEVFLPDAQSLKDKRMSVRRVKDRLKALGVAEVFGPGTSTQETVEFLRRELAQRRAGAPTT